MDNGGIETVNIADRGSSLDRPLESKSENDDEQINQTNRIMKHKHRNLNKSQRNVFEAAEIQKKRTNLSSRKDPKED